MQHHIQLPRRLRALIPSILLSLLALLAPTAPLRAAGVIYVVPGGAGAQTGVDWANASDLQTALQSAISGDQLWVKAGIYKPTAGSDRSATFQLKSGVAVYGGYAGTEDSLSQRDPDTSAPSAATYSAMTRARSPAATQPAATIAITSLPAMAQTLRLCSMASRSPPGMPMACRYCAKILAAVSTASKGVHASATLPFVATVPRLAVEGWAMTKVLFWFTPPPLLTIQPMIAVGAYLYVAVRTRYYIVPP